MALVEVSILNGLGARLNRSRVRKDSSVISIEHRLPQSEFLGQEVLYESGSFRRVKTYYRGWDPELGGRFTNKGIQGRETIVEHDVIRPVRTFTVVEARTNRHKPLKGLRPWVYNLTKILGLL